MELLFIDRSSYNERRNEVEFLAEANSRLSSPLISIAMALLAALAVMGGNFSRRGYSRRIVLASGGALLLIIAQGPGRISIDWLIGRVAGGR